eukprot:GHVS01007376.1.p1 GENE.GHVS01007376.1~~GHVS01007376.1.p1  ORF type:complete len:636 (-),score=102.85 GHVS01007376.1:187-2094(-)
MRTIFLAVCFLLEGFCVCSRFLCRPSHNAGKQCNRWKTPNMHKTASNRECNLSLAKEGNGRAAFVSAGYPTEFQLSRVSSQFDRLSCRGPCSSSQLHLLGGGSIARWPGLFAGMSWLRVAPLTNISLRPATGPTRTRRHSCVDDARELADRIGRGEVARRTADRLRGSSANFITVVDYQPEELEQLAKGEEEEGNRRSAEEHPTSRRNVPVLWGVPVGVKDNICVKGIRTTAGSPVLSGYHPSYSATVVERLKRSGGIIAGKTNMDEFAMGLSGSSIYRHTPHPIDNHCSPGGSSSGSAGCVASGELCIALGSDTGGSVRLPASWCGCVGLKPTYGRVSRYGLIPYCSSMDTIGPLGHSVLDVALLLEVIAGHDPKDYSSIDAPVPPYSEQLTNSASSLPCAGEAAKTQKPLAGYRIGVVATGNMQSICGDVKTSVESAVDNMKLIGGEVVDIRLPADGRTWLDCYHALAMCEASSNLSRYDGVRYGTPGWGKEDSGLCDGGGGGWGQEVRSRITMGSIALAGINGRTDVIAQINSRVSELKNFFDDIFQVVDIIVSPTAPTTARRLNEEPPNLEDDVFLVPASLAGLPALSLPSRPSLASGLPIGVQLIGKHLGEVQLLKVAWALEASLKSSTT